MYTCKKKEKRCYFFVNDTLCDKFKTNGCTI